MASHTAGQVSSHSRRLPSPGTLRPLTLINPLSNHTHTTSPEPHLAPRTCRTRCLSLPVPPATFRVPSRRDRRLAGSTKTCQIGIPLGHHPDRVVILPAFHWLATSFFLVGNREVKKNTPYIKAPDFVVCFLLSILFSSLYPPFVTSTVLLYQFIPFGFLLWGFHRRTDSEPTRRGSLRSREWWTDGIYPFLGYDGDTMGGFQH